MATITCQECKAFHWVLDIESLLDLCCPSGGRLTRTDDARLGLNISQPWTIFRLMRIFDPSIATPLVDFYTITLSTSTITTCVAELDNHAVVRLYRRLSLACLVYGHKATGSDYGSHQR